MFGNTPLVMVEDNETLKEVAAKLASAKVIGVDTESDSFYSYEEKVCLVQISDLDNDYIIDPLKVTDMSPLADVMADPEVVKIFHGADYDVVCLKRDYGWEIHNLFDTMLASQFLALPKIGLGDLIGHFFGWEIDKKYQRYDWSLRPLLPEHLEYARGDTHWLLAIREIMLIHLERKGKVRHLEEECRILEDREWPDRSFDEDGYLKIKKTSHLSDESKRILKRLYLYQHEQARQVNRPTFKVLSDRILIEVAERKPKNRNDLDRVFSGKHSMKRRYGDAMIEAVVEGLQDDFPIPKPKRAKPTGPPPKLTGRAAEHGMAALKEWRNKLVKKRADLVPMAVASNSVLKSIVHCYPQNLEELAEVPDIRQWQIEDFGEDFVRVLGEAVEKAPKDSDGDGNGKSRNRRRRRKRSSD